MKAIKICSEKMDKNSSLQKQYYNEGKKPNGELNDQIEYLSEEFLSIS